MNARSSTSKAFGGRRPLFVFGFLAFVLSGCGLSLLSDRKSNPVIEDYVGGSFTGNERIGTLATTASHRTVLVKLNTDGGVGKSGEFCPEPPPDAARSISDAFAAALQASVETPADQAQGSGKLALASTFSSSVAPFSRSPILSRRHVLPLRGLPQPRDHPGAIRHLLRCAARGC